MTDFSRRPIPSIFCHNMVLVSQPYHVLPDEAYSPLLPLCDHIWPCCVFPILCLWFSYRLSPPPRVELQEEQPQTAHPMSFTWVSHIAASVHYTLQAPMMHLNGKCAIFAWAFVLCFIPWPVRNIKATIQKLHFSAHPSSNWIVSWSWDKGHSGMYWLSWIQSWPSEKKLIL